jgi:adenylate cyclase
MTTQDVKRKLTAILSADVEGYSRLMREDELATVNTLKAHREAMSLLIQKHRGRVVDTPGDNLLAEFGSVVDAVQCAVEVQQELKARNAELPENRKMHFRVGINLGDVIEDGERIYGDGVNIAARVEGLAEGGGICISGIAFDSIKNKLALGYEYLGQHNVKNITEPVRVYRVLTEPEAAGKVIGDKRPGLKWGRRIAVALGVALVVVVAAVGIWYIYFRPSPMEVASVEKMAYPLPDKPSIAVLPFVNMSEDPKQEYIADGITEDIINALSHISNLFVIARNSTFTYKDKPVKVQQVSEELGVRYVLEGSIQKSGDRVRITVQLIDAINGHHIWAEKYDRAMKDFFALQDEIASEIMVALQVKLTEGEQARIWRKGTDNFNAYEKFMLGKQHFRSFTKEGNILARKMCEEAIALDPKYASAYVLMGLTHLIDSWYGWGKPPGKSLDWATEWIQKGLKINDSDDYGHANLGHLYLMRGLHDKAILEGEMSTRLNPNGEYNMALLAMTVTYASRCDEAISLYHKAIRLNPFPPLWYLHGLGLAYRTGGKYEEAIKWYKKALQRNPDHFPAHLHLAGTYAMMGRMKEARAATAEVLRLNPNLSLKHLRKRMVSAYKDKADLDLAIDAYRKAGLPD